MAQGLALGIGIINVLGMALGQAIISIDSNFGSSVSQSACEPVYWMGWRVWVFRLVHRS